MRAVTFCEKLTFSRKDFFETSSCLQDLLLSNNYFFVRKTFSDQLRLEYRDFFSTAAAIFRGRYFLRISNY